MKAGIIVLSGPDGDYRVKLSQVSAISPAFDDSRGKCRHLFLQSGHVVMVWDTPDVDQKTGWK